MKLNKYINNFPRNCRVVERERLGKILGRSEITIRSYSNGTRSVPAILCGLLSRATNGKVTKKDLRPDVRWDTF
ncbi:MAG: helix-turn-helix domain-containing protein [Gammaproteobacteria bacterium]|nr:helix-turn-helix domain-containing protein [Gammaproteobacteria bacterium]